ncbi:MAG: YqgE/AlgH family protein [Sandaracinaceae bacterium]|nr:YqgE/AlgH family protein [Sandaracinaceae bacterium]
MADTLAPGLLVASPALRDPNFQRAVIVLVEHGPEGSLGFIVNRPAPVSFDQVAELLGLDPSPEVADLTPVFTGGPVAPQSGWILFDPADVHGSVLTNAVSVSERLAVSASRDLLDAIASDDRPRRRLLALGYAGWAPGQLDGEFARGVWVPVDLDDEIVFETPPAERWHAALTSAGIDPARMSGSGGFSA